MGNLTASTDTGGNQLWTATIAGSSIDVDDEDDAFVCNGIARLIGPDGSTKWNDTTSITSVVRADVTNEIARCIGGQGGGIGIVAFQAGSSGSCGN